MKLEFEWHNAKAEANLRTHGVSFEFATTVFKDPFAIERREQDDYFAQNAWTNDFRSCREGGPFGS